jgi:hypothetical protein
VSGFTISEGKFGIAVNANKDFIIGFVLIISNDFDFIERKLVSIDAVEFIETKPFVPGTWDCTIKKYLYIKDQADVCVQFMPNKGHETISLIVSGVLL